MKVSQDRPKQVLALQAFIPAQYQPVSLLSELIQQYDVNIEILEANLEANFLGYLWLKLQIHGTNQQFFDSLNYLASCGGKIKLDLTQNNIKSNLVRSNQTSNQTSKVKMHSHLKVA
jgi:hypothetical protein